MRILHLLSWRLKDIEPFLDKIKDQGFDAIQINPLQPLMNDSLDAWWLSYQPCDLDIGNQYGSKEDLLDLTTAAHNAGIAIIADVIVTHVAGSSYNHLIPNDAVNKDLVSHPEYFREKKNIDNWESRYEITNYCGGLPTFDLHNHDLQNRIIGFLDNYIDLGIDGFRFDSAKSIATPSEGCDFFSRVLLNMKRDVYCYGEVIFANEDLISMYVPYLDVLTNTWSRNKDHVVVFSESHDSFYEFKYTANKKSNDITRDYQALNSTYPNTLYFARSFDDEWMSPDVKFANTYNKKVLIKSAYN